MHPRMTMHRRISNDNAPVNAVAGGARHRTASRRRGQARANPRNRRDNRRKDGSLGTTSASKARTSGNPGSNAAVRGSVARAASLHRATSVVASRNAPPAHMKSFASSRSKRAGSAPGRNRFRPAIPRKATSKATSVVGKRETRTGNNRGRADEVAAMDASASSRVKAAVTVAAASRETAGPCAGPGATKRPPSAWKPIAPVINVAISVAPSVPPPTRRVAVPT